jgi:hypothetical protein
VGQSPHGADFNINCSDCHTSADWLTMRKDMAFDHDTTLFALDGRHAVVDCRSCHSSLVFSEAKSECITCHTDIHQQTVGQDCARCHTANNWLVDNISELHQNNGFPLVGAHASASCFDCHVSESDLRFDRIGNDCISCHLDDYNATTQPNHQANGFSTNCSECHDVNLIDWSTDKVIHDFFPLTKGHEIMDCARCHTGGTYQNTPTDCIACHQADFQNAQSPNHVLAGFVTDCKACHTTDPGWMPAAYLEHDVNYFPIYSGKHAGTWTACVDCHANASNYAEFTCTSCHLNPETNDFHTTVSGYAYESSACLACHPTGDADIAFDHNQTNFPLTGAHTTVDCISCHASGYAGTPTECSSCHTQDFNQTINPNHLGLGFSMDCASCHTTDPDWNPASMPNHDDFYPLNGAHAAIANDCAACHNGNYLNTPTTCVGCHQDDFDQTTDPNHSALMFSSDCTTCHTENAWSPSTFDHDAQYFPIYSGKHEGEWSACTECHTNPANYTEFTCITCHMNPETDNSHNGVPGYSYNSTSCLACHPTGSADDVFDHSMTAFPLTGAHATTDCIQCHASGYAGTPTECSACHIQDFNQTINPNHNAIGLSTDCASCHTTGPGWDPATFVDHDNYYALNGAHAMIANDCAACHNGDYNNTPNTCAGCHQDDYNQTTNPNHTALQFSNDCATCHTENAWEPATFDHDGQYFPIYSGKHLGEWSQCIECHTNPANFAEFTCITCHMNPETDDNHVGVPGYNYNSTSCLACHPTGSADDVFDHNQTAFPLTGAHITADCIECHASGYAGTPTECSACHTLDFNQALNPNHIGLGFGTDCASCHTTNPGWSPAQFPDHSNYYVLDGAHASIANDCAACHNGDYNNTPNTCSGCHTPDFNASLNPNHTALGLPTDCAMCHTTAPDWMPASFPIHNDFYMLNGAHAVIANDCAACHNGNYNNTPNTCFGCHAAEYNNAKNPDHKGAQFSTDCTTCHTENAWVPATFDHDAQFFPIYSGEHEGEWNQCTDCHINPNNYAEFSCTVCHLNPETNDHHQGIPGYNYNSPSCFACHPNGSANDAFDHSLTNFPLTGAHTTVDCIQCHANGYQGTPTDCDACHQTDYNQAANPNHIGLNFSTDCATCHTTAPGWSPATFPDHNNYYVLDGAHAVIANDCAACHNGDYNNTPNTCDGCHMPDYNQSTNPNHVALNFSTDCVSCHTTAPGWSPANFPDHSNYYVLDGAHAVIANDCAACHNGDYNNTPNSCEGCHMPDFNQAANPNHVALNIPTDCASCHTTAAGWAPATFSIHDNYYVLDGAHVPIANDCAACHNGDYNNTPNTCAGCHTADYNQSVNPNHQSLGLPTDCAMCHTTAPDWMPATFPIHANFWPLNGAHAQIANDCAACHNGNYNNTPNTCFGCHENDYNQTVNPDHEAGQFPTDCIQCHSENAWVPATLDHSFWPLTGAHQAIANDCNACHMGNYNNTPNTCSGCHTPDYNQSTNPSHTALGLPMDCAMCHTTEPDWMPASFPIHDDFWPLTGAHAAISNDCGACHNGNYNNTPNTCFGCHASEYNNTNDPDHAAVGFPTDCESCHTTNAWTPSTWDHDSQYFPIYSGKHEGEWNACIDCHTTPGNYSIFSCIDCHEHDDPGEVGDDHQGVPGYSYNSSACYDCHPTGED